MLIRTVQPQDIETLFDIRTSVVENYQSREEIAQLGITPNSLAQILQQECQAWVAELDDQLIGFSIADKSQQTIFGIFVRSPLGKAFVLGRQRSARKGLARMQLEREIRKSATFEETSNACDGRGKGNLCGVAPLSPFPAFTMKLILHDYL